MRVVVTGKTVEGKGQGLEVFSNTCSTFLLMENFKKQSVLLKK